MGKGKKSVEQTYKYSYKVGDNLLSSLSVYNVGYQQCGPEQQWGPGIRDHYCIHHIISGKGTYVADKKVYHLGEGDSLFCIRIQRSSIMQIRMIRGSTHGQDLWEPMRL